MPVLTTKKQWLLLYAVMLLMALTTGGIFFFYSYEGSLQRNTERYKAIAKASSRMIETLAQHQWELHPDSPADAREATLKELLRNHEIFSSFGKTGEFLLGKLEKDKIIFVLAHRADKHDPPAPVSWNSSLAEPMLKALMGQSGTLIGLDYQGHKVLAAHEPVALLNLGLVVKQDLSEIRQLLIEGGLSATAWSLVIIGVCTLTFIRLSEPLIQRIKDQKEKLEKTVEELQTLSAVVEKSPASVVITDKTGAIQYVNPKFEEVTQYSRDEAIGKNPRILKSGKLPQETYRVLWDTILSGKTWVGTLYNKKKNGDLFWERAIIFSLKNEQGEIVHFVGLKDDITYQKHVEEDFLAHLQLSGAVMENIGEGIIIIETDERIRLFNPAAEKIFGYSANEVLGRSIQMLIPERYRNRHKTQLERYLSTGVSKILGLNIEVEGLRKDGSVFPLELLVTELHQEGKKKFIGLVRDISRRMADEERLQIIQKQMIAAEKLAGIGQLAAGVSHEILNPLNIISMHVQLLQRKKADDAELQNILSKIKNEINRIEKINKSLLTFSRKGAGGNRPIKIADEINTVVTLVEKELVLENIVLAREISGDTPDIVADPDELRQAFLNIMTNARHAMPSGGALTIRVQPAVAHNIRYARIEFEDSGVGISRENLQKIFTPFFTTKEEGKGTGLGLSVVHALVEKNGGRIDVESEEGKWARFTIDLPSAEPDRGKPEAEG